MSRMGEIKNRSIRLDDENWEWISKLPGRTQNEAIANLRGESGGPVWGRGLEPLLESQRVFGDEILEFVRSAPSEMEEACLRAISRWKSGSSPASNTSSIQPSMPATSFDPRTISGVSVGPPKTEGQFRCRCIHTGCRGAYFQGASRFQNLCDVCLGLGHSGDPRSCRICYEDGSPA